MSWNYRVVQYKTGGYGLHEVYYDENGLPWSMTKEPISFTCSEDESPDEICAALMMARDDAIRHPVFVEPAKWPGRQPRLAKEDAHC